MGVVFITDPFSINEMDHRALLEKRELTDEVGNVRDRMEKNAR
jgi:hypothetical protein